MPPAFGRRRTAGPARRASWLLALVLLGLGAPLLSLSGEQAFAATDTTPPTSPTNLTVTTTTQTTVALTWTAARDNVGVAGYQIVFGASPPVTTKALTWLQGGLACGQSYKVTVRAYDYAHNLSLGATALVSTSPCLDLVPPSAPTGLAQIAGGASSATLSWSASTDNVAVAGYTVGLGGTALDTTDSTSYTFVGLRCGTTYTATVQAFDATGNRSTWSSFYLTTSACGDTTPPTAPSGLTQVARTETSVSVTWRASSDNVAVARYDVFRDGTFVLSTTALSASVSGLSCGRSYTIGVEAVDGAGNRSAPTTGVMATGSCAGPGDTQAPTAPSNLIVTYATTSSITLSWTASSDNVGVAGYHVSVNGVRVHDTSVPSYTVSGLSCGTAYALQVQAYDAAGNVSAVAAVTAGTATCSSGTAPAPPANLVLLSRTTTSVTLSWAASAGSIAAAGYGAYLNGTKVGTTFATTYTFTGLGCGTSSTFGVNAYAAGGGQSQMVSTLAQTAACGDTQAPTAPTSLAVSQKTETSVSLSWAPSSDNVGVAGYDVYSNGVKVATVSGGTSSSVGGLSCGTAYVFGVEAFDAAGNRSARVTVSVSTLTCSSPPPSSGPGTSSGIDYVSPSGSDGNPCSQSAPCASFGRAYLAASPGDVVQVAGGSYPAQTLPADPTKDAASSLVVFQPAPGASVSLGGFEAGDNRKGVGPKHFELQNMTIAGEVKISWGTQDVTLRNIDAGAINLTATQDVRVLGGDFGPRVDAVSHIKSCAGCPLSQNILIDGATFHDYTISDPANHAECLMVWPGIDITIRNSIFRNCTDFDLLYKPDGLSPGTTVNFTVENDFFDSPMPGNTATVSCDPNCPRGGNALAFADNGNQTWNGVVVRYSSFLAGIRVDPGVTNVLVQANAGVKDKPFNCQSQVTFSYNVWTGATCSATDRMAPLADIFVAPDESSFNLDLKDGSPAIGAGDPSSYPSRDISGHLRPTTFPADAGASQREPALIVPGLAIGTARIGATQAALESFYGPSRRTTKSKLASGSPVVVAEYRVRGGWLLVTYRGPTGVIVATTSRYYRTLKGLGPSAVVAASTSKRTACRPVGAGVGRARMYIRASSGKRPVVTELFVTARGVVPPCAVVKKR